MVGEEAIIRALGLRVTHGFEPFMLGVTTTFAVLLVFGFLLAYSGAVYWIIGGMAEEWTSEELGKDEA